MKKFTIMTIALVIISLVWGSAAHAGAARRHTIEGFMLGTGAAILGTIIYKGMNREPERAAWNSRRHHRHAPYRSCRKGPGHNRGHWETGRIWIEPVYQVRWNPGHYTPRGRWVSGRNEKFIVQEGYWQEKRVWVRH
ncbi:hypothetical protein [Desulfospira joergensenii]|uniref:hypothetical protein n=1 Tax=Desulfospira joergensenii TaxID=53329 RepID=UPI0012947DAD|nr:hypothetical protein [Desulfospira joergensenii]